MDYQLGWYIPKRVLMLKVSGDVTLEDLEHFNNDVIHYLEEGTAPVHMISVGDNIRRVPTNFLQIKQIINYIQHPKMGFTIIVQENANSLTGFMISVASQATGMKVSHVKNVNDGVQVLRRYDPSINGSFSPV